MLLLQGLLCRSFYLPSWMYEYDVAFVLFAEVGFDYSNTALLNIELYKKTGHGYLTRPHGEFDMHWGIADTVNV